MTREQGFEVIIVGGSYAGLSAAMAFGRSLRKVLIIDNGKPCNRQTPHSHNFLTQDGKTPGEIWSLGKEQVMKYPTVKFVDDFAVSGTKTEQGFEIATQSGRVFSARKLLFATGIKDMLPEIEGLSACWGISVIHCPYCHGYEYSHEITGILGDGEMGFEMAKLISNWTKNLTVFTNGKASFTAEQGQKLEQHGIRVENRSISALEHNNGHIKSIIFDDGSRMAVKAVYARVNFIQHSDIPASLGCEMTEQGFIKVDMLQKTTVKGVYAAGDNASMMRSVANAVYAGSMAAAGMNKDMIGEDF